MRVYIYGVMAETPENKLLVKHLGSVNIHKSAKLYQLNMFTGKVTELEHKTTGIVCIHRDCLPFQAMNRKKALEKANVRLKVAQRNLKEQHKIVLRHAH